MSYEKTKLRQIYNRTSGKCHLCWGAVVGADLGGVIGGSVDPEWLSRRSPDSTAAIHSFDSGRDGCSGAVQERAAGVGTFDNDSERW